MRIFFHFESLFIFWGKKERVIILLYLVVVLVAEDNGCGQTEEYEE
jgi:hypothetical protein